MYEIIIDYERQLSPSSPIVCAEFEIIEEQLDGLIDCVSKYEDEACRFIVLSLLYISTSYSQYSY